MISKVVPKIWARTNSAMMRVLREFQAAVGGCEEREVVVVAAVVAKLADGLQV